MSVRNQELLSECKHCNILHIEYYSELVLKPRNREDCSRKGIHQKNTSEYMAGLTLALVCVAVAGLLVVIQ